MSNTTLHNPTAATKKTFSVADFKVFGERYGIDYRFPLLTDTSANTSPVLHGDVEEMILPSGISLTPFRRARAATL